MLLEGKRVLVTGVLNDASIAFGVARIAQEQGAEVVLSSFGRVMSLTQRTARKLPTEPTIVQLDASSAEDLDALAERVGGRLDGVVHAIGFAPESCLGGGFLDAPWEDVAIAMQVSAYSLKALAVAALEHFKTAATTPSAPSPSAPSRPWGDDLLLGEALTSGWATQVTCLGSARCLSCASKRLTSVSRQWPRLKVARRRRQIQPRLLNCRT